jgi:CBS domain containing-hemolysin-like protein
MTLLQTLEIEAAETLLRLTLLFLLVLGVAFFVAAELAIVSASKREINRLTQVPEHSQAALRVQHAQNNLEQYLSVTQTGTTAGSLLLGWLGEGATVHWIEPWIARLPIGRLPVIITGHTLATAIAFLFITYIEIVLGELIPKVLASQAPEKTALVLIRPLEFCAYLFFPALVVLNGSVKLLMGWRADKAQSSDTSLVQTDLYSVTISGAMEIAQVNQQLGLTIPQDEAYRSLAGFFVRLLGHRPESGDRVQWSELELEATEVSKHQIRAIVLRQVTGPLVIQPVLAPSASSSARSLSCGKRCDAIG